MQLTLLSPRKALNKAFLKVKPSRSEIELFKKNLIGLLDGLDETESEEHNKNDLGDFLKNTFYSPNFYINTKGRNDLVIHTGTDSKSLPGVLIEVKKPGNKNEMVQKDNLNAKAFQELILYYLRERITDGNLEIKYLIATNVFEWYIFDATLFEKTFAQNKGLVKQFTDFEEGRLAGTTTDFFYNSIAEPFISGIASEISFTHFDFRLYDTPLRNEDKADDAKLIALFKVLSPEHLLKLPFSNDSNTLDKAFYSELLHIIGLTETKAGSKKLIERKKEGSRDPGSLIENTILQLDTRDKISRLQKPSQFGESQAERLFNVSLELVITWLNRVLFLKLLEAQLIRYHKGDPEYAFLNSSRIDGYDDLDNLFFRVLARKIGERDPDMVRLFSKVPYLNSSLFEPTELEHQTIFISNLQDHSLIPILSSTVLKNNTGKKRTGNLSGLQYLFEFLDSYDFAGEGSEEIQEENKTLINASVLGLIFEKLNGYKDGSFFTPGFITMYMCRETIRRAVIQKFNEVKGWNCEDINNLYNKIGDIQEANLIIDSLKICDPAVGSGHFLVSALNEIISIKSDLRILMDRDGRRLKEYHVDVMNDELIITDEDGEFFEYNPANRESQRIQEALFHEKQTIIENCLFGVDINPNSVKICRLRLWIELLKSAYYRTETNYTELETLPNIDINIKCGNSLISRHSLDADVKQALKKSKWSIDSYRVAVMSYRNASNKEEKRTMERLIESIKSDFETEVAANDKRLLQLKKLNGDLFNLTNQTELFALSKKEKDDWDKKVKDLTSRIHKTDKELEEIKSNKIYENAFEWRFEFPEVLNDDGEFVGFDLMIGNPPYGVSLESHEIEYFRNKFKTVVGHAEIYYLFIELALGGLIKSNYILSYIIPNAWLSNKYATGVREFVLKDFDLDEIINFNQQIIFEDAQVETSIIRVINRQSKNSVIVGQNIGNTYNFDSRIWLKDENLLINFSNDVIEQNLLYKISSIPEKLSDFYDISNGCKPYQAGYGVNLQGQKLTSEDVTNRIYHSNSKIDQSYFPELKGKNVLKYVINQGNDFIKWGPWLMSPKESKYHFQQKILIRQIIGSTFLAAIDDSNSIADQTLYVCIPYAVPKDFSLVFALGIINSKLYGFYFRKFYSEEDDLFPKIKVNELKRLPFKRPNFPICAQIENRVFDIMKIKEKDKNADATMLETEIDKLVYGLYDLTAEEIQIVENEYNK
jgi:hypothetical protein